VSDDGAAFWAWSLQTYDRPGVAAACLALQDRHGADVNLVLLACWLASQGRRLDPVAAAAALAHGRDWQGAVTARLRAVRRHLKSPAAAGSRREAVEALRARVAGAELAAERLEQLALARIVACCPTAAEPGPALALGNLTPLLAGDAIAGPEVRTLLAATFPVAPASGQDPVPIERPGGAECRPIAGRAGDRKV
jgi:uncharacterized protein (TIGR02444 family)